jgi:hypothetical protein
MKYWLYLAAKLAVAAGLVYGLQSALLYFWCDPAPPVAQFSPPALPVFRGGELLFVPMAGINVVAGPPVPLLLHDMLFTFLVFGVWLLGAGLLSLSLWDQRRRCRTCLRKLIMPVASGSWGNMVTFGRPRTELICPYGHGTLSIEELQITGRQLPDWQPHDDDIWKELESYYQARR